MSSRNSSPICTLVTQSMPTIASPRMRTRETEPMSLMSLTLIPTMLSKSGRVCCSMSIRASQKPIRYMETAMELARVNMRPMAPPNSGPRDLGKKENSLLFFFVQEQDLLYVISMTLSYEVI